MSVKAVYTPEELKLQYGSLLVGSSGQPLFVVPTPLLFPCDGAGFSFRPRSLAAGWWGASVH